MLCVDQRGRGLVSTLDAARSSHSRALSLACVSWITAADARASSRARRSNACGLVPRQLFGYGRSDRLSKLIGGLESETAAAFRSRRRNGHDRIPITPHNAAFPTYKRRDFIADHGSAAAAATS